jgi:hypothetical protein
VPGEVSRIATVDVIPSWTARRPHAGVIATTVFGATATRSSPPRALRDSLVTPDAVGVTLSSVAAAAAVRTVTSRADGA